MPGGYHLVKFIFRPAMFSPRHQPHQHLKLLFTFIFIFIVSFSSCARFPPSGSPGSWQTRSMRRFSPRGKNRIPMEILDEAGEKAELCVFALKHAVPNDNSPGESNRNARQKPPSGKMAHQARQAIQINAGSLSRTWRNESTFGSNPASSPFSWGGFGFQSKIQAAYGGSQGAFTATISGPAGIELISVKVPPQENQSSRLLRHCATRKGV